MRATSGGPNVAGLFRIPYAPRHSLNVSGDLIAMRIDDASITAQVKYALLTHESTSALKTSVKTKDGAVAIEGEAGSAAEKDLVTLLANGVRGVKLVTNQMTVKG